MIKQVRYQVTRDWLSQGRRRLGVGNWDLCFDIVRQYFDIPLEAKVVYLTAHKQPGVDRVKIELIEGGPCVDGHKYHAWFMNTRHTVLTMLKKYGTFYVSAEYQS